MSTPCYQARQMMRVAKEAMAGSPLYGGDEGGSEGSFFSGAMLSENPLYFLGNPISKADYGITEYIKEFKNRSFKMNLLVVVTARGGTESILLRITFDADRFHSVLDSSSLMDVAEGISANHCNALYRLVNACDAITNTFEPFMCRQGEVQDVLYWLSGEVVAQSEGKSNVMNEAMRIIDRIVENVDNPAGQVPKNDDDLAAFFVSSQETAPLLRVMDYVDNKGCDFYASVNRTSSHYCHYNTISVSVDANYYHSDESTEQDEQKFNDVCDAAIEYLDDYVKDICKDIHGVLEREVEYQTSEEVAVETIIANEYEFDEDGTRDPGGEFKYEDLDDRAKERALEWWGRVSTSDVDLGFLVDEIKDELEKMGCSKADVSYSIGGGQGDGASFTCRLINIHTLIGYIRAGKKKDGILADRE